MKYDIVQHLGFIQSIISRMASISFLIKGWTITLVVALFALTAKDADPRFAILALFPALSFWGLDAYYLRQERLFRALYESICSSTDEDLQSIASFSLDTSECHENVDGWFKTLWVPTILATHGIVVSLVIIVIMVVLGD